MVQITLSSSTHARCVRFKSPLLSGCGTSSSTSSIDASSTCGGSPTQLYTAHQATSKQGLPALCLAPSTAMYTVSLSSKRTLAHVRCQDSDLSQSRLDLRKRFTQRNSAVTTPAGCLHSSDSSSCLPSLLSRFCRC